MAFPAVDIFFKSGFKSSSISISPRFSVGLFLFLILVNSQSMYFSKLVSTSQLFSISQFLSRKSLLSHDSRVFFINPDSLVDHLKKPCLGVGIIGRGD